MEKTIIKVIGNYKYLKSLRQTKAAPFLDFADALLNTVFKDVKDILTEKLINRKSTTSTALKYYVSEGFIYNRIHKFANQLELAIKSDSKISASFNFCKKQISQNKKAK